MSVFLLISALLLSASHSTAGFLTIPPRQYAEGEDARALVSMKRCRNEASPLVRLDCYDNALNIQRGETHRQDNAGPAWHRAMEQEKTRPDHATTFLVNVGTGDNPSVIITTPAIGVPPPRPVLMLSCIDNITRLQIASVNRVKDGNITLNVDQMQFDVQWFLRENGYLLESSRGLAGIDEIKRLMPADTLTIEGRNNAEPHFTFNISQLTQVIKPLRNACHW